MTHSVLAALFASFATFAAPVAHTRSEFHFVTKMPYAQAAPLFGAFEEQKWAPEFKPEFLYPSPAADREGSVFVVKHGSNSSIWVNTVYDLASGHVQYVYVLENLLVTRIDIHLKRNGDSETAVSVVYERTALNPTADDHTRKMGAHDAGQVDEWKAALDGYARRLTNARQP